MVTLNQGSEPGPLSSQGVVHQWLWLPSVSFLDGSQGFMEAVSIYQVGQEASTNGAGAAKCQGRFLELCYQSHFLLMAVFRDVSLHSQLLGGETNLINFGHLSNLHS